MITKEEVVKIIQQRLSCKWAESTKLMKSAIESIVHELDENDLLPCTEDNY